MTREDIIRIATSAGIDVSIAESNIKILERFADLVAAHEREECAKLCEIKAATWLLWWTSRHNPVDQGLAFGAEQCADAIRRRGEQ